MKSLLAKLSAHAQDSGNLLQKHIPSLSSSFAVVIRWLPQQPLLLEPGQQKASTFSSSAVASFSSIEMPHRKQLADDPATADKLTGQSTNNWLMTLPQLIKLTSQSTVSFSQIAKTLYNLTCNFDKGKPWYVLAKRLMLLQQVTSCGTK